MTAIVGRLASVSYITDSTITKLAGVSIRLEWSWLGHKYLLVTAWRRDAASTKSLRGIHFQLEMQEVGTSHREAVKVTLFVFL